MLFLRKPRSLGPSRADSLKWDSTPFPSLTATPLQGALEHWYWVGVCWLSLLREELVKAQVGGYSTQTGDLAHPWLTPSLAQVVRGGTSMLRPLSVTMSG